MIMDLPVSELTVNTYLHHINQYTYLHNQKRNSAGCNISRKPHTHLYDHIATSRTNSQRFYSRAHQGRHAREGEREEEEEEEEEGPF